MKRSMALQTFKRDERDEQKLVPPATADEWKLVPPDFSCGQSTRIDQPAGALLNVVVP